MKTYQYLLTKYEIFALSEALDKYYFETVKNAPPPNSPLAEKTLKAVKPLLEQFKDDIRLKIK